VVAALYRTLVSKALVALQEELLALAPALPAFCIEISCHELFSLDPAPFGRTAAVVRNRGYIGNARDLEADGIERAQSGFATGAAPLYASFQIRDAVFLRGFARGPGRNLRGKRCRFARALEAARAAGCPRQGIALPIGDRHDGVVERSVDMGDALRHVLLDLL